jgi:RND family efflux transporter MFP subunit
MYKKIIVIVVVVLLVIAGIFLVKKRKHEVASAGKPVRPEYKFTTAQVKISQVTKSKEVLSKIVPDKKVVISSKIVGYVKKVYYNAGDRVRKGDIIAEIDDTNLVFAIKNLENQLDSLKYQLKAAKSEFDFVKEKFKRDKILIKSGAISREDFQKSKSNYENAKNNVLSLEKRIKSIMNEIESKKHDLIYTKILSSFDATISKEFLKQGALVGIGTPIIEMISNSNFKILFQLPPNEAKELNKDSFIEAKIGDKLMNLKINKIYPESETNSLVTIESRIADLPVNIPSNSYISINVIFYKKSGATVPINAVLRLSNGNYVIKKTEDSLKNTQVNILFCDNRNCLIKSKNLEEGDIVVVGTENKLRLLFFNYE